MKYICSNNKVLDEVIYLLTKDFKLVYKIDRIDLSDKKIIHITNTEKVPPGSIILTDFGIELPQYRIVRLDRRHSHIFLKVKILEGVNEVKQGIIIGVDPGGTIGMALLLGEHIVTTGIVMSIRGSIQWIQQNMKELGKKRFLLRIGDGLKGELKQYIHEYRREFQDLFRLEIVDEMHSSIKITNEITIHEQSAVVIARREGREFP